jgi:4-amino-4-deoxy-L-arabinose transferase-like glycosyltransferase
MINNKNDLNWDQLRHSKSYGKRWLLILLGGLFISIITFLLVYRLNSWPSVWWDEGWYLDAARNWIEKGHLGHFISGQPIPPRIPVRFPVVVLVTLSMKVFGVGVWQARLPIVITTILSLFLFTYLSSKIYNRKVALVAIITLLISSRDVNPIIQGRQILAEMPMMFYILGGYVMMWLAIKRTPFWGLGSALFFGLAIHSKLQVPPFWLVSMILAIWMAAKTMQYSRIKIFLGVGMGSIAFYVLILLIQNKAMPGSFGDPALINILFNSVILVLTAPVRKLALFNGVMYALPQIIGVVWAGKQTLTALFVGKAKDKDLIHQDEVDKEIFRAALWGLAASWGVWYFLMALYWMRYMLPSFIFGCIFFVAFLENITNGFDMRFFVRNASALLLGREFKRANFLAVITLLAFSLILGSSIKSTYFTLITQDPNPNLVDDYLKNKIPPDSRVETFESELIYLAPEMNFHYPSDLVSMQLIRKWCIDPQLIIDYNPLNPKPEYIISGWYDQTNHLYDEVLAQGLFKLEADIGGYKIYHNQSTSPNQLMQK